MAPKTRTTVIHQLPVVIKDINYWNSFYYLSSKTQSTGTIIFLFLFIACYSLPSIHQPEKEDLNHMVTSISCQANLCLLAVAFVAHLSICSILGGSTCMHMYIVYRLSSVWLCVTTNHRVIGKPSLDCRGHLRWLQWTTDEAKLSIFSSVYACTYLVLFLHQMFRRWKISTVNNTSFPLIVNTQFT